MHNQLDPSPSRAKFLHTSRPIPLEALITSATLSTIPSAIRNLTLRYDKRPDNLNNTHY
jgi:hypothetical protein